MGQPHFSAVKLTAVGDSLTQGVGDPTNKGGYTHLIRQKVIQKNPNVHLSTANYGISGETTNQINHRVVYSKRLQHSIREADVITITTGGNDLLKFLKANVVGLNKHQLNQKLTSYCQTYQARVTRLFRNIRHLNRRAPIFVFGIYNPVYVYFPQVNYINDTVAHTNQITNKVIHQQHRMYFVSINKPLTDGQFTTAKSRKALEEKAAASIIAENHDSPADIEQLLSGQPAQSNKYLSNDDHFHPNLKGYQIMTNRLYSQMAKHISWLTK
ncbi:GDSL-type esterase/lipase family protein [Lentilactobacillus buchneri]|nr:GDSL-type esterase/lipase family protein [Lentilactobacillus sp. Egmn17]